MHSIAQTPPSLFTCTPSNPKTCKRWEKIILDAPLEKSLVEVDVETVNNIETIWASIAAIAPKWRGNSDYCEPGQPVNRKEFWGSLVARYTPSNSLASSSLSLAEKYITSGDGKLAFDLGCGNSSFSKILLEKGWHVVAVDYSKSVLDVFKAHEYNKKALASGQLIVIEADITTFTPAEPADLILAADILPYIDPCKFQATWLKIHDTFLKENGILIGSFFRSLTSERAQMNVMREMGAWFIPDTRMLSPLLKQTGYKIENFMANKENPSLQFVAKKIEMNSFSESAESAERKK